MKKVLLLAAAALIALSVSAQDVSAEFLQRCYSGDQFALWDTVRNNWFFGWGGPWTCASGYICSNGICVNPCDGVRCSDKCEGNFRQFGGACSEGNCRYESQYCQFGCSNGKCNPDTTPPSISSSISPSSPTVADKVVFSVGASDASGIEWIYLYVDGRHTGSCVGGMVLCSFGRGPYSAGTHTYEVFAKDKAGNSGTGGTKTFAVSPPPCTNECSSGEKKCSGGGYVICGNYNGDSCLEWSSELSCKSDFCDSGYVIRHTGCSNGNCVYSQNYCQYGCNPSTASCNPCPNGQTSCAGSCVNTETDIGNCGSCGNRCQTPADKYSSNFCSDGKVYRNRIFYQTSCSGGSCQNNPMTESQIVESCQYGCSNGACNVCSSNTGNVCASAPNACGQTNTGAIKCDNSCSATAPANPANYGSRCTASNACGTNYGTITCSGSCSVRPTVTQEGWKQRNPSTCAYQNSDCSWWSSKGCIVGTFTGSWSFYCANNELFKKRTTSVYPGCSLTGDCGSPLATEERGFVQTCQYGCSDGICKSVPLCQEGWKCKDSATRAYQNGDCIWGSNQYCQFGCANGACNSDPCAGITCNSPPASYCIGNAVISYNSPGTCSGGKCSYATTASECRTGTTYGDWSNYCSGGDVRHSRAVTTYPGCANGQCGSASTITQTEFAQRCQYGCSNGACLPPSCAEGWKCVSGTSIDYQYPNCGWWLGGGGTSCGGSSASCSSYCGGSDGKQWCVYPAQAAYCQNQCSGNSCRSCAPSCGSPSCSHNEGRCGYTACKENPFSVSSATPYSQSSYPGASKSYSLSVTNNDNSYCSPKTYKIGASVPAGFAYSLSSNLLTLKPGAKETVTISIQSSSSASGAYYPSVETSDGKTSETRQFALIVTPPKWNLRGQAAGSCSGGKCYAETCDFNTRACARTDKTCQYGCNPASGACYSCSGDMSCG